MMERRILKNFCIGAVERVVKDDSGIITSRNVFGKIVGLVRRRSRTSRRQNWNRLVQKLSDKQNPIGCTQGKLM